MSGNQISQQAADTRTGITLAELERLIDHARAVHLPDHAVVTGAVADHGQLLRLTIHEPQ